jgi:hypothetical protein
VAGAAIRGRTYAASNVSIYGRFAIAPGGLFAGSRTCQDEWVQFPALSKLTLCSRSEPIGMAVARATVALMLVLGSCAMGFCMGEAPSAASIRCRHTPALSKQFKIAQEANSGNSDIPPGELEKYVAIYLDMQKNRSLTVEQAAAKEGLSLTAFRELEQRVERDDAARQHVRDELEHSASQASAASSTQQSPPAK